MGIPNYQEYAEQQDRIYKADLEAKRIQGMQNALANGYDGRLTQGFGQTAVGIQQNMANAQGQLNAINNAMMQNAGMSNNSSFTTFPGGMLEESRTNTVIDPNKNPALVPPLSAIIDMWRAAFGDTWVGINDLKSERDFWRAAASRMQSQKLMETWGSCARLLEEQFWKS